MLEARVPGCGRGSAWRSWTGSGSPSRRAAFDAVVLHLILAVIPDPVRCLQEAARALRPGGRMVVFDKFVRGGRVPLALRLVNPARARALHRDDARIRGDPEGSGAPLVVAREQDAFLGGLYRQPAAAQGGVSYCGPSLRMRASSSSTSAGSRSVSGGRTGPASRPTRRAPAFTMLTA